MIDANCSEHMRTQCDARVISANAVGKSKESQVMILSDAPTGQCVGPCAYVC